jgi:threonine/homoserine/homoserine lactone efflux protein
MPGPLLTVTIAQTASHGFIAALALVAGHSLLELFTVFGIALGLGAFLKKRAVTGTISIAGGLILIWMGWGMLPGISLALGAGKSAGGQEGSMHLLELILTGAAVSVTNPYWVVWWATIGVTAFATLSHRSSKPSENLPAIGAFYFGHIMGDIIWYLLVGAVVATGRSFISPMVYKIVVQVCGGFLILLGASFIFLVVTRKLWSINMSADWLKQGD